MNASLQLTAMLTSRHEALHELITSSNATRAACSEECEREYVHGCMAFGAGCHDACWEAVRNNSLHGFHCARECHPTWLMMTARCGRDPDARPPVTMTASFDERPSTAMDALAAHYHVHVGSQGSIEVHSRHRHVAGIEHGSPTRTAIFALCLRGGIALRSAANHHAPHRQHQPVAAGAKQWTPADYVSFPAAARAYSANLMRPSHASWDVFIHSWVPHLAAEITDLYQPAHAVFEPQTDVLLAQWRRVIGTTLGSARDDGAAIAQVATAWSMRAVTRMASAHAANRSHAGSESVRGDADAYYTFVVLARPDVLLFRGPFLLSALPPSELYVDCWGDGLHGSAGAPDHPLYAADDLFFAFNMSNARRFTEGLYEDLGLNVSHARRFAPIPHNWIRPWVRTALGAELREAASLCNARDLRTLPWMRSIVDELPPGTVERFGVGVEEIRNYCGPGSGSGSDCTRAG